MTDQPSASEIREQLDRLIATWRERAGVERADRWCNTEDAPIWRSIHAHRAEAIGECADELAALRDAAALAPQRVGDVIELTPDVRGIVEALGFDPTNHHNAARCPYCQSATKLVNRAVSSPALTTPLQQAIIDIAQLGMAPIDLYMLSEVEEQALSALLGAIRAAYPTAYDDAQLAAAAPVLPPAALVCPRCASTRIESTTERYTCLLQCGAFGWPSIGTFTGSPEMRGSGLTTGEAGQLVEPRMGGVSMTDHCDYIKQAARLLRLWAEDRQRASGKWTDREQAAVECAIRLEASLALTPCCEASIVHANDCPKFGYNRPKAPIPVE